MKRIKTIVALIIILQFVSHKSGVSQVRDIMKISHLNIIFEDSKEYHFSRTEKELIKKIAIQTDREIRMLLPDLNKKITLRVIAVPYDLEIVGGITGRAVNPREVTAELSYNYKEGVAGAAEQSLSGHLYHEFHHIWKRWTLSENKFGKGIDIAAINEGLADVFSKTYTGYFLDIGSSSDDIESWTREVLKLPKDADYNQWMNQHEDGRIAIGYRVGTFIVENAMKKSGKTIIELSELHPKEILSLSGLQKE